MAVNETPRYQNVERPRETSLVHQPVVICIDTSGSMNDKSEDGRTKAEIVEEMLNSLANLDLPESDKAAVDICILVFDDECRTLVEWRPLTYFEGGLKLDVAGCTALGSAVIKAIDKTRERRRTYDVEGISSKRAQIFLYTDGVSTEDMTAAYQRAEEYLNREKPSAKMYAILIPPARDPKELAGLGKNVAILAAKDCINGIPATFPVYAG